MTISSSSSFGTGVREAARPAAAVQTPAAPVRLMKVVPTLLCGGTESQVMTLCRSLDRARFDLEFACLRRLGPFVKELAERGHPLEEYRLASFRSVEAVRQQLRFSRHLVKRDVQIVHAYNFYGNVFAIPPARLARTPVVIASIRDLGLYLTPSQKRLQRHVCRLADCVVVNAEAVKAWLVGEGYSPRRIVVINNGVDLTRFDGPSEPERVRRDLGVPDGAPLVAVVSRLSRMKGLEQFLEAAAGVRHRWPDARFLIIGETPVHDPAYLDDLKRHARAFGLEDRVVFTGLRSDVPTLLKSVNVAVMPSLNEALSNALLESMAAGAPVVATRVGGTPEALVDGETGLLVPPGDVGALTTAVGRLLESPELAARLGCAARAAIAARFSVARMTDTTARLYQDLLTHRARNRGRLSRRRFSIEGDRMTWLQQSLP